MPSVTSICCSDAAVHLRVRPHRRDQLGDPSRSRPSARRRAACASCRVLATHSRPGSEASRRRGRSRARVRTTPTSTPAAASAGAMHPVRGRRRARRASRRAPPRGRPASQRVDGARHADRPRAAARPARRTARPGATARPAGPATRAGSSHASSERVDRARRRRRRVVDLVREPGRERPQRDQRLALARSALRCARRSGRSPRSGGRRTGTTRRASHEGRRRHPQQPPAASRHGRSRGTRRRRPRRGTRPAHTPGPSIASTTVSSRPSCRTRSTAPSSSTHQKSAGSPSVEEHRRRRRTRTSPGRDQLRPAARR